MERKSKHLNWRQALDVVDHGVTIEHLSQCMTCEDLVDGARVMVGALRYEAITPSDDHVLERVQGLGSADVSHLAGEIDWACALADRLSGVSDPPSLRERLTQAIRRFDAVLKADSATGLALAVRGAAETASRVLVFETPFHSISLSVAPSSDPSDPGTHVTGQLIPREGKTLSEDARIWFELESGEEYEAELDSFGQFDYDDLPSTPVRLTIVLGDDLIQVGPIPPTRES